MNAFGRALRDAFRYWHLLALSVVCSAGVATLWGANIAALFPIIEVTLHGESIPKWNRDNHDRAVAAAAALQAQLKALDAPAADPPAEHDRVVRRSGLETQLQMAQAQAAGAAGMQAWLDAYFPSGPFATIMLVVALVLLGNLAKHVLQLSNSLLVGFVSTSIARDLRTRLFDKALELDRPAYLKVGTGGFATQITHSADALAAGITGFYGGAVTEPLKIVACLVGAAFISWRLTVVSLLAAPLMTVAVLWLNRQIKAIARRSLDRSLGYHHLILESLNNLVTVQAFTMEPFERERFRSCTKEMMRNSLAANFYHSLAGPVTEFLGIGMVCTAIVVGSHLVINQQTHLFGVMIVPQPLSASGLMVFFGMLIATNDPIRKLSGVVTSINVGSAAAGMLYDMIDQPSRVPEPAKPAPVASPHRTLEFRDVCFSYDGGDLVLKHVNWTIPFGRRAAIVGPNGGGKSTLLSLLSRFYDPTSGEVLMDGVPLKEMSLRDLRGRIALVTQQTEMFHDTILFNVRYGRWDATEEEVVEACRKAHAHEFITSFPEGYQTIVGPNGQRLSGGQRQRIALARAILRDAELLVLDEATSQIDAASEELIHDALEAFSDNRTVLMITHRKSTLELADEIVQIERGVLTVQPKQNGSTHRRAA